jgi:uncharacterized protein (TIGR02246 family)
MDTSPVAVISAYFEALNRSDPDALASLFDDDGVFMGDRAPSVSGREKIRGMAAEAFAAMRIDHQFDVDRVDANNGFAAVRTHSAGTLTMLATGTVIENAHRELFVLRDRGDGWRIADYMYNTVEGVSDVGS